MKRCGSTQILSSGTPIAKEHVGTGVGETGGKRRADTIIKGKGPVVQSGKTWEAGSGLLRLVWYAHYQ